MSRTNLQDAIFEAIETARRENLLLINQIRWGLALSFLVSYLVVIAVFNQKNLLNSLPFIAIQCVFAAAIHFGGQRKASIRRLSRFGIAFLDVPMLLLIQSINLTYSPEPKALAAFTASLCVFFSVMAGMTLEMRMVLVTTLLAVICQTTLQLRADATATPIIAHTLIIVFAGIFSSHIPKRGMRVVREAAEKQLHRDALARYFSPGVAEAIETRPELDDGQSCEVSVLFLDLRGFTALTESLDSRRIIGLLNEFFAVMVDVIFRHGGTLDKYLGDGLMAYFNAPVTQPKHACLAVRAALAMTEELERLNARRSEDKQPLLRIGIGIHTGEAVVGTMGAPNRPEYTAVGDTVNVASRLESLTKNFDDVDILVSEQTVERCGGEIEFRELLEVSIRGKRDTHRVYTPA